MPAVRNARSVCYLFHFTGGTIIRAATRAGQRGAQFSADLVRFVEPSIDFDAGRLATGQRYNVVVAEPTATKIANDYELYDPKGSLFDVVIETTVEYEDGTTSVLEYTVSGKYVSHSRDRNGLTIVFGDTDAEIFDRVYPSAQYTVDEYPNIDPAGAGQPICFPVGTALKLPCRLLATQTLYDGTKPAPEWLYGVCELEWQSYSIVAVNTSTKQFSVAGNQTSQINVGDSIWVFDPNSRTNVTNEGKYTVSARTFSSPNTVITVNETINSATVTSKINIPPRVLNVYRNGRLVNPVEYTVEVLDNEAGPVPASIGDFSTGATDWSTATGGTGTASLGGATASISGDGTATNFGRVTLQTGRGAGVQQRRHQYAPWRITVTGTGAAWMADTTLGNPIAGNGTLVRAGAPTRVLVRRASASGDLRCFLGTGSTGVSGTSLTFDNWSIEQPAKPLLMIRFTREQRDPGGGLYNIEADVFGYRSRNVVDEINRIIGEVGGTSDITTFSAAQSVATDQKMIVDCAHGGRGVRKVRAILEDLLFVARGMVYRADGSAYRIVQDTPKTVTGSFNELQGDLVRIDRFWRDAYPDAVGIRYRPSSRDPNQLTITRKRVPNGAVVTGTNADPARECPYLRDHEAADRLVWYLSERSYRGRKVTGQMAFIRPDIMSAWNFSSRLFPNLFFGNVVLARLTHKPSGVEFEGWTNLVDNYALGTLPPDPVDVYQPDYSQTPPAAPTGLRFTAAIGGTGRASVECIPPAENWAEVWFVIIHNTNNQVFGPVLGDYNDTTNRASTTIGGLTTGQVYKLQAYAKNAFLLQGTIQGTFDNTANGGGPAVTTFTA
jgi:hypothetical protein